MLEHAVSLSLWRLSLTHSPTHQALFWRVMNLLPRKITLLKETIINGVLLSNNACEDTSTYWACVGVQCPFSLKKFWEFIGPTKNSKNLENLEYLERKKKKKKRETVIWVSYETKKVGLNSLLSIYVYIHIGFLHKKFGPKMFMTS